MLDACGWSSPKASAFISGVLCSVSPSALATFGFWSLLNALLRLALLLEVDCCISFVSSTGSFIGPEEANASDH